MRVVPLKPPTPVVQGPVSAYPGWPLSMTATGFKAGEAWSPKVRPDTFCAALGGDRVDGRIERLGLDPVGLDDLRDEIGAATHAGKRVIAVGVGEHCCQHVAAGVFQVHGPALQARLARIFHAITVQVVVDIAGDGRGLEVAEVQAGLVQAALGRERVVIGIDRLGLRPARITVSETVNEPGNKLSNS